MNKKISPDEKIFIAGSRGMAGSAICRVLDKKNYGKKINGGKLLTPDRNELNLSDSFMVQNWFEKNQPSVVILAAAKVGGIMANSKAPYDFLIENLKIQTNVIENSFKYGVKRFVFLGSSCIYPKLCNQPIKEEYLLSDKLETTNEGYALAKIAGIKMCDALRKQHDFDAISLMPTNLYGPGDNYDYSSSHVMASFIRRFYEAKKFGLKEVKCWGSGNVFREFMHADDLGEAIVFALERWDPKDSNSPVDDEGRPLSYLNVGTGKDILIKHLAEKIALKYDYDGKILWDTSIPDGTPKKQLDITKFCNLGWNPKIELDEGIKLTVNSFIDEFDIK